MRLPSLLPVLTTSLFVVTAAASFLRPPVLPLAVRNPYLSLWYNSRAAPFENWPFFWNGQTIGMGVLARLPSSGTVLPLLGRPQDALLPPSAGDPWNYTEPVFTGFQYDSQTTNLTYTLVGTVNVTLVFTSPITGDSVLRQSLPASYFEVIVQGSEDVEIYVDLNGMWVTGDASSIITWSFNSTSTLQTWEVRKQNQLTFSEIGDRGEWGTLYFTAALKDNVTFQTATSGSLRRWFATTGSLNNTIDQNFRSVQNNEPVWAFAKSLPLGSQSLGSASVLFTIAFAQDPLAQFAAARGLTQMRSYYKYMWKDDGAMLDFHYFDYVNATASGAAFAEKVKSEATTLVSSTYADILALSARQAIGGTVFSGTPSDPILFLKEISSDGNMQTVDVIMPAFPFFLYLNPDWLAYMLEPLLEHQLAGLYPNAWSMHDLGSHFPNATGHPDGADEPMPVEESGNMLYMAVAYVNALLDQGRTTDAVNWIIKNGAYALWKQWANFLVEDGLIPADQLSTDDFAGSLANQSDLAVKAIVGIKAMARLAEVAGEEDDFVTFTSIAGSYLPQFIDFAKSRDGTHTKLSYRWFGSWGSLYNLYGDALLCFDVPTKKSKGFFPYETYRNQSEWYFDVRQRYGLPLDSRHLYAKSDWELWIAAISSEKTRQAIVESMGSWVNNTPTNRPMTDLYDTETGDFPGITFMARPVVGGHFSVMALNQACNGTGFDVVKAIFGDNFKDGDEGELGRVPPSPVDDTEQEPLIGQTDEIGRIRGDTEWDDVVEGEMGGGELKSRRAAVREKRVDKIKRKRKRKRSSLVAAAAALPTDRDDISPRKEQQHREAANYNDYDDYDDKDDGVDEEREPGDLLLCERGNVVKEVLKRWWKLLHGALPGLGHMFRLWSVGIVLVWVACASMLCDWEGVVDAE